MGFLDIQKFNNALLAKRVWRLIHQKDTLLYKVFSTKFFPMGVFLMPIDPKCSYAWRCILQAREFIEKGAFQQVGSGQMIDVWKHRWLPDPSHNKIVSPRANSTINWVSELFYSNTRIWDPGKLESNFYPQEADMVSRIQVSEVWDEDLLVWPLTTDGSYSVRRAYCLLALIEASTTLSSSTPTKQRSLWKSIWKFRLPIKLDISFGVH